MVIFKRLLIVRPWASFIPTIEVDGLQHRQWKLRDFFSAQLCSIYQLQVDFNLFTFDQLLSTFRVELCQNIAKVFEQLSHGINIALYTGCFFNW